MGYQLQQVEAQKPINSIWKRRSRFEVIADIPKVVRQRGSKAKIMLGARINGAIAGEYLTLLEACGLLRRIDVDNHPYLITERGMSFLEIYDNLNELLPIPAITKVSDQRMYM